MAQLNIVFTPPGTVPSNGYRVRYRVKSSGASYTTVSPNPTSSPVVITGLPVNTDYEGIIEGDCGGGLYSAITNFNSSTCFCASGYTPSEDKLFCYKIDEVASTPPSDGTPETTVAKTFASYSNFGSYIYQAGFNSNGTGTSAQINSSNPFWINSTASLTNGPLNRAGLWSQSQLDNQDVGFAVCIDLPSTKLYYIGIAGDNRCRIKLDSNVIVDQSVSALMTQYSTDAQVTFKIWHIYPLVISSGPHIIELIGHNDTGAASLGAEIYDATPSELIAATSYAALGAKLIFSTKDYVGQNVQLGTNDVAYTCPAGYSLKSCVIPPVCVRRLTKECGDFSG